jgi:hypothetical protein
MTRRRIDRILNGPGMLPSGLGLPLDILMLTIGFAIYPRIPHANAWTIAVLVVCAACIRRLLCEIVSVTRIRGILQRPTSAPRGTP